MYERRPSRWCHPETEFPCPHEAWTPLQHCHPHCCLQPGLIPGLWSLTTLVGSTDKKSLIVKTAAWPLAGISALLVTGPPALCRSSWMSTSTAAVEGVPGHLLGALLKNLMESDWSHACALDAREGPKMCVSDFSLGETWAQKMRSSSKLRHSEKVLRRCWIAPPKHEMFCYGQEKKV